MLNLFRKCFSIVFAVLLATVSFQISAFAQTETGQILGTVVDQNGAVVAGATIEIKNTQTTATRTLTANDEGFFISTSLQPGTYDVTVKSGSFQPKTLKVAVSVGGRNEVKFELSPVGAVETVNVSSDNVAEINTSTQDVGNVVSQKQITELPNLTRNPYALVALSGNVSTNDASGRGAGVSINGQRSASTEILLDGTSNTDAFTATVGQNVPLDAVDQFRVITGNFSAEYGRASGGIVSASTKGGSNEFHGTGYEFNRNARFSSNGFDANANKTPRGVFNRNQFGYSLGGRIIRDKLFFFSSTEWIRVKSTGEVKEWIPTTQFLAGGAGFPAGFVNTQNYFSNFGTLAAGVTSTGNVITGTQIGGLLGATGSVTANLPILREIKYQANQNLGGGTPQNTYFSANRVDWNLSDKTQIYGTYSLEHTDLFKGTVSRSPYADYNTGQTVLNASYKLSITRFITSSLTSQTKLNFNRLRNEQPLGAKGALPALYTVNGNAASQALTKGQSIVLPGYLPTSPNTGLPFGGPQNFLQIYEDLSKIQGNHQVRFGGQYVYLRDNRTFGAYQTANELLTTSGTNISAGLNNLLAGNIARLQVAINPGGLIPGQLFPAGFSIKSPNFSRSNRYSEWALYINDAWRFTPRLTLNLGARYEYFGVQHNKDRSLDSNFYYGPGTNVFQRIKNGNVDKASNHGGLWKPDRNNFAPRLGFAWDVFGDGKTSVRGGYGIAYERNFGNVTFNVIQNPPNYAVVTVDGASPIQNSNLPILGAPVGAGCGATNRFCVGRPLPPSSLRWVDENIRTAYAHQWGVSFQREVFKNTVVSLDYTGSAGRKLYSLEDPNALEAAVAYNGVNGAGTDPVAVGTANGCPASYFPPTATTTTLSYFSTASRLNCRFTNLNRRSNGGYSNYKGLILSLESNNLLNTGIILTSRYTFSKAKDNLSSTFSESANNFNLGLLDPFNPSLDYGTADFDTRHRWVSSFIYEVPLGKNSNALQRYLLSGWSVNGTVSVESGAPFTVYDSTNGFFKARRLIPSGPIIFRNNSTLVAAPGNNPNVFTYIDLSGQTPGNYIPRAANGVNTGNPCGFLNPDGTSITNALCLDDSSVFPANQLPRNAFRGPGYWNVDFGLYKRINITERYKIQIRAEAFNLFNHANTFIYNGDVDLFSTSAITAGKFGNRDIQLAVKFIF